MGSLLSILYLLLFCAAGYLLAQRILPNKGPELLFPLGCGFGVSLLAALPALFALPLGFKLPAVLLGGAVALLIIVYLLSRRPQFVKPGKDLIPLLACAGILFVVTCVLLHTHILDLVDGAYHTGQSCYGDTAMHLAFIKSIAVSGEFPPKYPLLAGDIPFNYPFLCETVSSVFLLLGGSLRLAFLLPLFPSFISVYGMGWHLARRITASAEKACLAFWLFFMGSGFGFFYFLDSKEDFHSIFTGFYTTPTNYTVKNVVWVNPIADLLIPQRATLFGWCVLFPALYLLWRFAMEAETRLWLPLLLFVLPLPLMQTHSALALVLFCLACGFYTLFRRKRCKENLLPWLWIALLCGVVWVAIGWSTVFGHAIDGQRMLRFHFNWVNGGDDGTLTDNYFWFYIKNIGIVYLLLVPAFIHAKAKQRWFYGGSLLLLVLAEFVEFQSNNYDNNKLLYFWHLIGCILVAQLLCDLWHGIQSVPVRVWIASLTVFAATFGSVLTIGRELVSDYTQWSADDIAVASYVDANTAPDVLFLTDDTHLMPVSSLAGRHIVCGSGSFVFFHGMDYSAQYNAMQMLYTAPDESTLAAWGIDYVLFDNGVYNSLPTADEGWYSTRYPLWYQNDSYRIYQIS